MAAEPDRQALAVAAARLFASADGRRVLAHLHALTYGRTPDPAIEAASLRHLEGQRWLVRHLLTLIERGGGRPPALTPTRSDEVPHDG